MCDQKMKLVYADVSISDFLNEMRSFLPKLIPSNVDIKFISNFGDFKFQILKMDKIKLRQVIF